MIYLDNAATTKIAPEVLDEMMPFLTNQYGNAGSIYEFGVQSREAIDKARCQVAKLIGASPEQIVFTSGGTEANNLVFKSFGELYKNDKKVYISAIEHDSVRKSAEFLKIKRGFDVVYLPVDQYGCVTTESIKDALSPKTGLISVMFVNNEIGSVNQVNMIGQLCRSNRILFHSDCVQAVGMQNIDVNIMDADFVSLSAHKIHAPKGVGALYVRDKSLIEPLIHGGANQEFGLRGGTENVAGIVGFGKACDMLLNNDVGRFNNKELKKYFWESLLSSARKYDIINIMHDNAMSSETCSKILSVRFDGVDAEALVLLLSVKGVCVSAGSACRSLEQEPSHVLTEIGLLPEMARSTIRISISEYNTLQQLEDAADIIAYSASSLYRFAT